MNNLIEQEQEKEKEKEKEVVDLKENSHTDNVSEPDLFSSLANETSHSTSEEKPALSFDIFRTKIDSLSNPRDEIAIQRQANYLATLQVQRN